MMHTSRIISLLATALTVWVQTGSTLGAELLHRYSFTSDVSDSVGSAHGALRAGASITNGQVTLNGVTNYVELPSGLLHGLNAVTIGLWRWKQDEPSRTAIHTLEHFTTALHTANSAQLLQAAASRTTPAHYRQPLSAIATC